MGIGIASLGSEDTHAVCFSAGKVRCPLTKIGIFYPKICDINILLMQRFADSDMRIRSVSLKTFDEYPLYVI